ncbi:hypothetical protein PHYPSEUDO_011613 [Phytophthora pseudosyringae]|uniref:Transmembrane protein n=1 Tax=Phytophthora pseudosyringae TaxID=221518 RepID=A0A8T1V8V9_9STRA|nr:hypothetical protein PHYPSEUDO_011613 [Phytophthora pseudosyringae]
MDGQAHGGAGVSSATATSHPSSFMPVALPTAVSGGDYLQRSFTPTESAMNDMTRTNALADRNTIVDMSLRLARFVLCVVAALIFAFGFALLTSNKKTLTHVYANKLAANETLSSKASSVVEDYNTLFGYILFAGGKVFEVFCETLIFPTLATYLHNCSLYPGDQPTRVHSVLKERGIFWGLKTVIILMNVGFTSVYVGKTTLEAGQRSRSLAALDEFSGVMTQMETPWAVDTDADVLHSILRTSVTGVTTPFEFDDTCKWSEHDNKDAEQQWGAWADDVDTTSVSFSFLSHAWSAALLSSRGTVPTRSAEIPLRNYLANREKYAVTKDWDALELYSSFQQGMAKLGLASASASTASPRSFDELLHVVAGALKDVLPSNTRVSDFVLRLEHRKLAGDVQFTSLTVSIPVEAENAGTTLCGTSGCVYATSSSVLQQLHLQSAVSIAAYEEDKNSALVYSSASQFVQEVEATQAPHEVLTLSVGKLAWQLSPLHIRHDAACADDGDQQCLGLSLPFSTGDGVLLVGKEALAAQHVVRPVALVTLHPAMIPDMTRPENDALTSWHRLASSNGMLVRPSLSDCTSLVDAYLTHLEANHFYLDGQVSQDMYSAALFYLAQRGVPTSFADAMSRRRLALSAVMVSSSSGSGNDHVVDATTDIEVNVPTATALVTVAGCIFIVLLMLCVIYLPTSRVKLSPDTTPAAQYVQILTDDLYPDVVHKKRLRFANGDCLLFNEYVVDAIVLHAKRDQTKKIYLLYPGDQPTRVHSVLKERGIFWGLKTVIILMNVGFTSVYVGKTTLEAGQRSRSLAALDEFSGVMTQMETPWAVDTDADVLHSILRTSVTGVTTPFEFDDTCKWSEHDNKDAEQQWGAWADDVDTTSVSFSFLSHAWSAALLSSRGTVPTRSAEIPLRNYLANREKYAVTKDWDALELYSSFQQGMAKLGLASASASTASPRSFDELLHVVAGALKDVLPSNTRVSDFVLRLEHRKLAGDVQFTSLTVSIPVEAENAGTTLCGTSGCVYATSSSVLQQLHLQSAVSIAAYEEDKNSALVYSSASQFVQEVEATQAPHEVLTLSVGKLAWQLSPLHIRHDAACADDGDQQCLGLSLPFSTGDGVLLVGKEALAAQHVVRPVALVTLHPAMIPDMTRPENDALTSWHRLASSNGMLVRPSLSDCTSLVDAYLTHLEANHFYLDGQVSQDMYSAALFYLAQRGVPTSFADAMSRRRLALSAVMVSSSSGSGNDHVVDATTDIEVNVPTATALVTVAGCIFIVLLMLCVIYLPTSRVKLSPDTTPAAQYVQILTDDLYPDVVHKKRLRFANGDCLLFNEYVVDAIVLHAKRDQTKKIYL